MCVSRKDSSPGKAALCDVQMPGQISVSDLFCHKERREFIYKTELLMLILNPSIALGCFDLELLNLDSFKLTFISLLACVNSV